MYRFSVLAMNNETQHLFGNQYCGSISFRGWHQLKISRLRVKIAWRLSPFGGQHYLGIRNIALNFGIILGIVWRVFFVREDSL